MAVKRQPPRRPRPAAVDVTQAMLRHDLQVHQEELRSQNEKLIATLHSLEETHLRYLELYDASPVGYVTLDAAGLIQELNIAAATLIGRPRAGLVGVPLAPTVAADDRPRFRRYLRLCVNGGGEDPAGDEVRFVTAKGERIVHLSCQPRRPSKRDAVELFVSLVDVTEQRRLEAGREQGRRQQAQLVREVLTAQEAERRRIAQDIHDDLGQQVTGLRMTIQWLAGALPPDPNLRARVQAVQEAAARVDQHVDFLIRDLRPAGLEDLGLASVLRQAVADWGTTFGVDAAFRVVGGDGPRLPPETEVQAYRIVQEALTNVHKHAAATQVVVTLDQRQRRTVLSIADDGVGISAPPTGTAAGARSRLGLLGMRERATAVGGELSIASAPGEGTTVTLTLP